MAVRAVLSHDLFEESVVQSVVLREAINAIFDCEVRVRLPDPDLDLEAVLDSTVLVQIYDDAAAEPTDPETCRFVNGVIEEAEYTGWFPPDRHEYRLRIRPPIHSLHYRFRTRIFQQVSPIDAIKQVLADAGIEASSVEWHVANYTPREYLTQWKESELAFCMRLLEELGIRFWFEHREEAAVMIVSDNPTQHESVVGDPALPVVHGSEDGSRDDRTDGLHSVAFETRQAHDKWSARDWNWETPDAPRNARAGDGGREYYEYPGGYPDDATAGWLSGVRAEELIAEQNTLSAATGCRRLLAGRTFELSDCAQAGFIGTYLVIRAVHTYESAHEGNVVGGSWRTELVATPASAPYRPPRLTPRPRAWGKESAVVTSGGEEIHVDPMGRIKVHFYWDREGAADDTATCWMRVQQLNTAGGMALPRQGWEVDVGFLDGDPDRPVVLQKLYNTDHQPPYGLPDNLMQSSLQTSSSPGGGGTNEIRLNDANGGQEFFVHAQKDFAATIGNDASEDIAVDSTIQVGSDHLHKVGGDESLTISGNQSVSVTGVFGQDTVASQTVNVSGLDDWGVGAVHTVRVKGARTDDISGLLNVLANKVAHTFNAGHKLDVTGALAFNAVGPIAESVKAGKQEFVGGAKLELISKSKAENIGVGKILNSGAVQIDAGTDVNVGALGALAITTGGPLKSKCGGDFGISGRSVTVTIGSLKLDAGGSIEAGSSSITLKGSSVGASGAKVLLKGEVHYK